MYWGHKVIRFAILREKCFEIYLNLQLKVFVPLINAPNFRARFNAQRLPL